MLDIAKVDAKWSKSLMITLQNFMQHVEKIDAKCNKSLCKM